MSVVFGLCIILCVVYSCFIHVLLASAWLYWPGCMGLEREGEAGGLVYI